MYAYGFYGEIPRAGRSSLTSDRQDLLRKEQSAPRPSPSRGPGDGAMHRRRGRRDSLSVTSENPAWHDMDVLRAVAPPPPMHRGAGRG